MDREVLVRFIEKCASYDDIFENLFLRMMPGTRNIQPLANALNPESRARLLQAGASELAMIDLKTKKDMPYRDRAYLLGYHYFKAAVEGTLVEAELAGESFHYFVLPHETVGQFGRLNTYAYAVSDSVPERLRPVVAYHEYVESRTLSHKKAIEAELEAVRSLGLQDEYAAWLGSRVDVLNGRAELLERLRET